ncbi:mucin-associated surface protein (MASP), putative, partial [Trypanosoma cruzi marinkellei]
SPGNSATKGVKGPALKSNSGGNQPSKDKEKEEEVEEDRRSKSGSREAVVEEETQELKKDHTSHEAPVEIHGSPATEAGIQPQAPTSHVNGPSSPEKLRSVQQPQGVHSELDPNNNSQTGSGTPITINQHNETSADHAELKPPSPTANGDAANNETDKSTEEGAPNNGPAADGAGVREEKQNENKESTPKEVPVEATVMKNATTTTTGNSDGSTTVSHSTSPVLLLLVACAAAAAVVAA